MQSNSWRQGLASSAVGLKVRQTSEAMDFVSSTAAIDFCVLNKLAGVQLVLKFDEQQYDIVLPVLAAGDAPAQRVPEHRYSRGRLCCLR